ncbi:MAG: mechanosensitive ion channel family protein [Desulfobacterales bacterium]
MKTAKESKWHVPMLLGLLLCQAVAIPTAGAADRLVEGEPLPVSEVADEKVQQQLSRVFHRIEAFEAVEVEVAGGVAVLSGRVSSFAAAEKAVDLAARLEGVLYVVDEIDIQAKVDSRLAPAWRKVMETVNQAVGFSPLVAIALLIFAALYGVGWLVTVWEWPYQRFKDKVLLQNLIRQLVRIAFGLAGLLIALEILELTALIGAVVGAAGLFGLAIGFAFKDIVENYIAGFLLSIRSPFDFMDWIGVNEHQGSVVRVSSRELVIMTQEGNHVRIPNAQVFKSVIYNYTRNPLRRFDIRVGIGVNEDLSEVQRIGCAVLAAMKGVAESPGPTMRNLEFGDSTMNVSFSGWVDQTNADFLKVRSEGIRILSEALGQAGVEIPVPIQKVINVGDASLPAQPEPKRKKRTDLLEEAETADVDRESYLDEQIDRERRGSGEADLLTG